MAESAPRPRFSLAYVRNLILFLLVTLFIGLMLVFSYLCFQYADSFVNHPRIPIGLTPEDFGIPDYESLQLVTDDGLHLEAWFIAPSREDGASFIFLHGHGGNRSSLLNESMQFLEQGYGALYFDFRAQGESEGDAITMSVKEVLDVQAAFAFMIEEEAVNPARIALYAESMGASTAIRAAATLPEIRVVIADSAYTNLRDVLADGVPVRTGLPALFFPEMILLFSSQLSGANYFEAAPIEAIDDMTQPIFLMHGTADDRVFVPHAERLFAAANEPKELFIVEGAGHIAAYETDPEGYREALYPFLGRYFINE